MSDLSVRRQGVCKKYYYQGVDFPSWEKLRFGEGTALKGWMTL